MPRTKQSSKRRRQTEVVPVLGVVGASLALASGASAATGGQVLEASSNPTSNSQLALSEEEISDVTLASFYVFDKENAGAPRLGERLAWRGCGRLSRLSSLSGLQRLPRVRWLRLRWLQLLLVMGFLPRLLVGHFANWVRNLGRDG